MFMAGNRLEMYRTALVLQLRFCPMILRQAGVGLPGGIAWERMW